MSACGAKRTFGAMDEVREVPNPAVGKLQFHSPFWLRKRDEFESIFRVFDPPLPSGERSICVANRVRGRSSRERP